LQGEAQREMGELQSHRDELERSKRGTVSSTAHAWFSERCTVLYCTVLYCVSHCLSTSELEDLTAELRAAEAATAVKTREVDDNCESKCLVYLCKLNTGSEHRY
jgi:hypothetical protein